MVVCCLGLLASAAPAHGAETNAKPKNCDRPNALAASGFNAEARAEYITLLGTLSCAKTGLAELREKMKTARADPKYKRQALRSVLLRNARALRRSGLNADATKKLQEWATKYPGVQAPDDLRDAGRRTDGWQNTLNEKTPDVRSTAEKVAVALAALALLLLV
jgi:hypothetical protein